MSESLIAAWVRVLPNKGEGTFYPRTYLNSLDLRFHMNLMENTFCIPYSIEIEEASKKYFFEVFKITK